MISNQIGNSMQLRICNCNPSDWYHNPIDSKWFKSTYLIGSIDSSDWFYWIRLVPIQSMSFDKAIQSIQTLPFHRTDSVRSILQFNWYFNPINAIIKLDQFNPFGAANPMIPSNQFNVNNFHSIKSFPSIDPFEWFILSVSSGWCFHEVDFIQSK